MEERLEVTMNSEENFAVLKAGVPKWSSKAGQYNYEEDAQEKSSSQGQARKPHKW